MNEKWTNGTDNRQFSYCFQHSSYLHINCCVVYYLYSFFPYLILFLLMTETVFYFPGKLGATTTISQQFYFRQKHPFSKTAPSSLAQLLAQTGYQPYHQPVPPIWMIIMLQSLCCRWAVFHSKMILCSCSVIKWGNSSEAIKRTYNSSLSLSQTIVVIWKMAFCSYTSLPIADITFYLCLRLKWC